MGFFINFNYSHWQVGQQATAMDILSLMISIPESFKMNRDLYKFVDQSKTIHDSDYKLKAVIVYSGAHYIAYTRNIMTKLDYVLDPAN